MARYFFDLHKGDQVTPDLTGIVCANDERAIRCGRRSLAACMSEPATIQVWHHTSIEVRREDSVHVACIGVTIEVEEPARGYVKSHCAVLASVYERSLPDKALGTGDRETKRALARIGSAKNAVIFFRRV